MTVYRPPTYVLSRADISGTVAALNFMTLLNPAGSGKVIVLGAVFLSSYSVGAATVTEPIRGHRISAHSGGTLADNATEVARFSTSQPVPVAQLRYGNPAVTLGVPFFNSPPPVGQAAGTAFVHEVEVPAGAPPFLLLPGEGAVVRTAAGDIDQHFNITIAWSEAGV